MWFISVQTLGKEYAIHSEYAMLVQLCASDMFSLCVIWNCSLDFSKWWFVASLFFGSDSYLHILRVHNLGSSTDKRVRFKMKCKHAGISTAIRQERIWNSYYKLHDNFYFDFGKSLLCGNKKKLPLKCTKGFFGKNAPKKSLHILRRKMSEVAIFREWVLEVEVTRTMQDSRHFYFPVLPSSQVWLIPLLDNLAWDPLVRSKANVIMDFKFLKNVKSSKEKWALVC
jgi:hypothetical protein